MLNCRLITQPFSILLTPPNLLRKRNRTFATPENGRHAGTGWDRRAAFDRRDGKIQFGPGALPRQRDANRMKERLSFQTGPLLDPIRHRPEAVAIDERSLDRGRERRNHLARALLI